MITASEVKGSMYTVTIIKNKRIKYINPCRHRGGKSAETHLEDLNRISSKIGTLGLPPFAFIKHISVCLISSLRFYRISSKLAIQLQHT